MREWDERARLVTGGRALVVMALGAGLMRRSRAVFLSEGSGPGDVARGGWAWRLPGFARGNRAPGLACAGPRDPLSGEGEAAMNDETHAVQLSQVRDRELAEIVIRRREAGLTVEADETTARKRIGDELVGLALSGGGIRSASFNVGLIQSLQQSGLLRQVDYLSTVSGGGYAGACLSSLALHPNTSLNGGPATEPAADDPGALEADASVPHPGTFALAPGPGDRQPWLVRKLVHGGSYLSRPVLFLNRYLIGAFLINLVTFSGVFLIAALTAWAFRQLDQPDRIDWIAALGFPGDIQRAFFPSALFFGLWVLTWGLAYWRKGAMAPGRVPQWLLVLTVVSFLLALAALLGTGDISMTYLKDLYGIEPPQEEVHAVRWQIQNVLLVLLFAALLPYLRVHELIRSGTRPRNAVEGWIFAIASRALVYGLPLLIFAGVARENLSRFNANRHEERHGVTFQTQYHLVPLEILDWAGFWHAVELQSAGFHDPANDAAEIAQHPFAISGRVWSVANRPDGAVRNSLGLLKQSVELDRRLRLWDRWLLLVGHLVTGQANDLMTQYDSRVAYRRATEEICRRLDQGVLRDLRFHEYVQKSDLGVVGLSEARLKERKAQVDALVAEAEQLQQSPEKGKFLSWLGERDQLLRELDDLQHDGRKTEYDTARARLREVMGRDDGRLAAFEADLMRVNWSILKAYYSKQVADKSFIFARVVLDHDQEARLSLAVWAGVLFLISACVVNLNATSMHGFYRNRLSKMWLTSLPGMGRTIPLARLETTARGAPYHLFNATVLSIGRRRRRDLPATDVFVFSRVFCGSDQTGYIPTEHFLDGTYDLANVVALSGGAVTPTQVSNPLLALLLLLSNSRLGQWLPNPSHRKTLPRSLQWALDRIGPVPLRLLLGALRSAEHRDLCFLSDGGHVENLGLETLLRRRCRVILVSDMTCDPEYQYRYLMEVLRRARSEHGIQFQALDGATDDLGLDRLAPDPDTGRSASHFFVARIVYPPDPAPTTSRPQTGVLIFLKPTVTGDEDADLEHHRAENPAFPHDPTADQFYDADKFESYRQLGYHTGQRLKIELPALLLQLGGVGSELTHWASQSSDWSSHHEPWLAPSDESLVCRV
ncbi:MAG: hypothetical protein U0794_01680 [Isosphaeraceae bacterium]